MKVYFNTKAFDELIKENKIAVTTNPRDTTLLVLGAKPVDYPKFINLKAVYRFGIGSENIDYGFLKKRSIFVYFPSNKAKEILYDSTANFTVYGILFLLYNKTLGDVRSWKKDRRNYIGEKRALVIGLGNIGSRVVKKLKSFMKVDTYDAQYNKENELEPLIRKADIITVHIPLNNETNRFFETKKLGWVKNDALIVNTARGALFDEDALYEKLTTTNCRAFFDVFWQEPYHGKLKNLGKDKFFMTPHSASNTKEFIQEAFKDILNIMERISNE